MKFLKPVFTFSLSKMLSRFVFKLRLSEQYKEKVKGCKYFLSDEYRLNTWKYLSTTSN